MQFLTIYKGLFPGDSLLTEEGFLSWKLCFHKKVLANLFRKSLGFVGWSKIMDVTNLWGSEKDSVRKGKLEFLCVWF